MKVGLIIDNPIRDLPGALLLTKELFLFKIDVYLIPMYSQGFDVPLLGLDIILMNYIRTNNYDLIKKYKSIGCKVFVLDTEGGIISENGADSIIEWPKQLISDGMNQYIDGYFFWGPLLLDSFKKTGCLNSGNIFLTGNPRFDFCNERYSHQFKSTNPYILINTNFSSIIPKYSTSREEEYLAFKTAGWQDDYIKTLFIENEIAFEKFLNVIVLLLEKFPNRRFKIRPHPFESEKYYKDKFARFTNCVILQDENIFSAIYNAECVIHLNCGTSVESIMFKKIPIQLNFLNNKFLNSHTPLPSKISITVNSEEELINTLHNLGANYQTFNFDEVYNNYIFPFFFKNDGNASARIAKIISSFNISQRHIPADRTLRVKIKSFLGSFFVFRLKQFFSKKIKDKSFTEKLVFKELLSHLGNSKNIKVENVKIDNLSFPLTTIKCTYNN